MIRVAMLSFWHVHARDYARQVAEHPDTEIVAVWDEIPERGQVEADRLSVPFYASLDELLGQEDIDGVIVDAPTNMHGEVLTKAAVAGKHIFTEKVLALTLEEANRIVSAVQENGVRLTVSLPRLNDDYTVAIEDILAKGWLGQLSLVRVRLAHHGASNDWLPAHFYDPIQCGGGALTDLGCHPLYLTRLFLGLPQAVSAHYGYLTNRAVEDNAVAILTYEDGALGVVETSFVSGAPSFSIEIHGTKGSVLYGFGEDKLLVKTSEREPNEWTTYELGGARPSALEQWVKHIQEGTAADENVAMAIDLTRLVEAANRSVKLGAPVKLTDLQG
ncbi:Gfo/Idh/MocA family protein [Alicyclobacillus acidiphilus]|uniref:Gfo/Idh/MocA family protein n=1 Tax=Alicyclobacillus acidiphilus TaxID=182455 RepID=UPI00083330CC|nr:Gfo/Idh/MocA family oxidoreductase [Alicyclobacillus acidiphilus]